MTPDYQRPPGTAWQVRLIQVFATVVVILVVFVGLTSVARRLGSGISNESTATSAVEPGREVQVVIAPGSPASVISVALADAGVIGATEEFEAEIRARGVADQLQAGVYTLITGTKFDLLIDTLVVGPAPADVYLVTVIEGLTIDEVLESLASPATPYTVEQLKAPLIDGTIDSPYLPEEAPEGSDELVRWEGLLAPDTYEFRVDASPAEIVGKMVDTLASRVSSTDWNRLDEMGLDAYDGLIIASL
ncbi:MAG: endolytic transglycosylase MltG, partial [Actinomycetota bacterium]|nr:endolytic transglycosylase MltG [Actinomycetota bacterium]